MIFFEKYSFLSTLCIQVVACFGFWARAVFTVSPSAHFSKPIRPDALIAIHVLECLVLVSFLLYFTCSHVSVITDFSKIASE